MKNTSLENISLNRLPITLSEKMKAVLNEDENYAADELVELGEEVLSQLAAIGFAVYLQQPNQKEIFNDFLINLFGSSGHDFNAGPLYRWAANMVLNAEGDLAHKIKPYFWDEVEGKLVLNTKIHHLASLRNEVMHGFFVLPPERNQEEANKAALILEQFVKDKLFETNWGKFSFLTTTGFNGNWSVDENDWEQFSNCYDFSQLAARVRYEWSASFQTEEKQFAFESTNENSKVLAEINHFLESNTKGALAIWNRPFDPVGEATYKYLVQNISTDHYLPIYYTLHKSGVTYLSSFLLHQVIQSLGEHTKETKINKDPLKAIKELRAKCNLKPVIVLNAIHISLFNEKHLLNLANVFFDNDILLIGIGVPHPFLNRYFNKSIDCKAEAFIPTEKQWKVTLENYLRFKTNENSSSDSSDTELLEKIIKKMLATLKKGTSIVAREFADANNFPMEFVHECFAILHPYFNLSNKSFELDEIDELYEFPIEIKESSRIFLTLGRRDIKLEYQHKILSL
jgi:hypothetical protein